MSFAKTVKEELVTVPVELDEKLAHFIITGRKIDECIFIEN